MKQRQAWMSRVAAPVALCGMMLAALPAHALYKVVGPDGKVSYTDRPPVSTENKVQPMSARGGVSSDAALPLELRQATQRYPVTLYVSNDCDPCNTGRQLLRDRGIPFSEKLVVTADDAESLVRLTGARDLPALAIGAQVLRGLRREDWMFYLDAAGYPKESRLPANFRQSAATPLTERTEAAPPPRQRSAAPAAPTATQPPPPDPTGFRF